MQSVESARTAVLVPGQDALVRIGSEWQDAPGFQEVAEEIRDVSQTHTDVALLLSLTAEARPVSSLNAHMLLTAVAGVIERNLQLTPDIASGHSAGLPVGLFFLGGYTGKLAGLTAVMEKRALLLEDAQRRRPGAMYAFLWRGPDGFARADAALAGSADVWLACYNWQNDRAAQVVLTAREAVDMNAAGDGFGNVRLLQRLAIGVGAHSPLVTDAAAEFSEWLFCGTGTFQPIRHGTLFVSDHQEAGSDAVVLSDTPSILRTLGSIDQPVRFQNTVEALHAHGITRIIEVGSSSLGDMIDKMGIGGISVLSVENPAAMEVLADEM